MNLKLPLSTAAYCSLRKYRMGLCKFGKAVSFVTRIRELRVSDPGRNTECGKDFNYRIFR